MKACTKCKRYYGPGLPCLCDNPPAPVQEVGEPRTFWLATPDLDFDLNWKRIFAAEFPHVNTRVDALEVIEKSAYDKLQAECERLKYLVESLPRIREERDALATRLAELQRRLGLYGQLPGANLDVQSVVVHDTSAEVYTPSQSISEVMAERNSLKAQLAELQRNYADAMSGACDLPNAKGLRLAENRLAARDVRIAELEKQLAELEKQLAEATDQRSQIKADRHSQTLYITRLEAALARAKWHIAYLSDKDDVLNEIERLERGEASRVGGGVDAPCTGINPSDSEIAGPRE